MAQKARMLMMTAMALALPFAAQAGERYERYERDTRAPIVLNGQLRTGDFTGGVGYSTGGTYYVQGFAYGYANSGSSAYAGTRSFVSAAARASASASASAGFGHR